MKITYKTETLPPTEMWIEGNTARDYESLGWDLIRYEAPPENLVGVWPGKALIRKKGGPTKHTFSPELCALHQYVSRVLGEMAPPFGKNTLFTPSRKDFEAGRSRLYDELDYHEKMRPLPDESLEDVTQRIAQIFRTLEVDSQYTASRDSWGRIAEAVSNWTYTPT